MAFLDLLTPRTDAGAAPDFPGRTIRRGSDNVAAVTAIQHRLNLLGCGVLEEDGIFGHRTAAAVRLCQARSTDPDGLPLKVDGEVGPLTWAALFGIGTVEPVGTAPDALLAAVLEIAASQVGVQEDPPGSNRGPEVDEYLRCTGLNPTLGNFAWCCAFVYWCFDQAAARAGHSNPMVRTAGVMNHWRLAGQRGTRRITAAEAAAEPALVRPGSIFIISTGGGKGHTGLVERMQNGKLVTIEGNTSDGGSREGIGVFRRDRRTIGSINTGFIDYGRAAA